MSKTIQDKRQREKEVVSLMISLYCRKNHGGKTLCPDCAELQAYAMQRSDKCPFMETKTFCSNCRVHCYHDGNEGCLDRLQYPGVRLGIPYHLLHLGCEDAEGGKNSMKKLLNILLLVSFVVTIMVPLTGISIHKLASVLFLLLTVIHTVVYRKGLGAKRILLLGLIALSFASGLLGMILDQYAWILIAHRVISIAVVFFAAIHIFLFHKRLLPQRRRGK